MVKRARDGLAVGRELAVEGTLARLALDLKADRRAVEREVRERQAREALAGLTERADQRAGAVACEIDFDRRFHLRRLDGAFPMA